MSAPASSQRLRAIMSRPYVPAEDVRPGQAPVGAALVHRQQWQMLSQLTQQLVPLPQPVVMVLKDEEPDASEAVERPQHFLKDARLQNTPELPLSGQSSVPIEKIRIVCSRFAWQMQSPERAVAVARLAGRQQSHWPLMLCSSDMRSRPSSCHLSCLPRLPATGHPGHRTARRAPSTHG